MVHAADRWEQVGAQVEQGQQTAAQRDETIAELTQQVQVLQADVQQRDTQIQQLRTTVTKMGSRESTLMRCILGLERRLAGLEKRPARPKNHAMSDKSSPLKRLVIEINVWVKLPEGDNIFTLLRILMQVMLFLSTAWRESHASHYGPVVLQRKYLRFLRCVKAKMVSHEVEREKWRRLLLHWMYDTFGVSTDGREEDFFPRNGV
ncbi:hypothetical protein Tco_0587858 [Tanacetum coccineum]